MSRTMSPLLRTGILLAVLMFVATALAYTMKPTIKLSEMQPREKLESLLPQQFGNWRSIPTNSVILADPKMLENLKRIYTETLSRTYVDSRGRQIMLSIAYGDDQSDSMQVHKPEVCYPAQGFVLENKTTGSLEFGKIAIPITRIATTLGQRREPVTYWTTVGDQTVKSGIHKKLVEMSYGLTGKIPDGMLVRVSSIDPESGHAYTIHERFIDQLASSLSLEAHKRLTDDTQ